MAGNDTTVLAVDATRSFKGVTLIGIEPRMKFKSDEQDTTKAGDPKWDLHLSVQVQGPFGTQYSMIKCGVVGADPSKAVSPNTLVELVGLEIGLNGNGTYWFRAEEVRPLSATAPRSGKAAGANEAAAA